MFVDFDLKINRIFLFFQKMSRTTFLNVDDTKAGMEDLDKEKINKLIQDASKSRIERKKRKGCFLKLFD